MTEAKKTTAQKAADAKRSIQQRVFAARMNMEKLARTAKGQVGSHKYSYVTHENVIDCCLVPLMEEGVLIAQEVRVHDGEQMMRTALVNCDDPTDFMFSEAYIPRIQDPQKIGSWMTYLKKYTLKGLLGLPDTDDDDGASASGTNAGNTVEKKKADYGEGVHAVTPTEVKLVKEGPGGQWKLFAIDSVDGEFTTFEPFVANACNRASKNKESINIKFEEKKGRVNAMSVVD